MSELLVRFDDLAEEIQRRAAEHGVSPDEEVHALVRHALQQEPRPPSAQLPASPQKEYTLFDHLKTLAEVAPDIDFTPVRTREESRFEL